MNRRDVIIPRVLTAILALAISPYFLLAAVLVVLFSLPHMARKAARWLRFRVALCLHAPVPADGESLAGDDLAAFTDIMRGWKRQPATEPEYERRRQR